MMFYTHLVFSLLVGVVALDYFSVNIIFFFASLLFFTAFVDIDEPNSKIGRKLGVISWLMKFIFGHRTFFHSLLLIVPGYLLLSLLPYPELSLGFLLGTSSHLVLDALTKEGVMPFYPLRFKIRGFVRTGGWIEKILFLILSIFLLLFLL